MQTRTAAADPDLFNRLVSFFGARPDRAGEVWVKCPNCGKERNHFSFSERGAKCFACDYKAGLRGLAVRVGLDSGSSIPAYVPPAPPKPKPAAPWLERGVELLTWYATRPGLVEKWQAYKPISPETIRQYRFGYGPLPFRSHFDDSWKWSKGSWLIVPLFENGRLVGLRGRTPAGETRLDPEGKTIKWMSATGTRYSLFGAENLRPGCTAWIMENYVDAAWLAEVHPGWVGLAIGGASNWRDDWTETVVRAKPGVVVVALDNDLAGQAAGEMYERLQAERVAQNLPPMTPNGPKIANALRSCGIESRLFRWPADYPAKADIGLVLSRKGFLKDAQGSITA